MEMPRNQNDNITSLTGNNSQTHSQLEIIVNLICKNTCYLPMAFLLRWQMCEIFVYSPDKNKTR